MTATQGREGRRRRPWLTTTLAAAGFCLAAATDRPAQACHITHNKPKTTTAAAQAITPSTPAPATSTDTPQQAMTRFMKAWNDATKPEAQVIAPTVVPTSTTPAPATTKPVAAQVITPPAAPSVQNYQQATSTPVTPPTPTCASTHSPTAAGQTITPPSPLQPPSALLNPGPTPTPAPEPSTILSAIVLVGAFAWRRRAVLARA